jgi:uncharacterized protein (TIGR02453 family)
VRDPDLDLDVRAAGCRRTAAGSVTENFTGFRPAALKFFRELSENQDRVWFQANKEIYEREVVGSMRALVTDVAGALAGRGIPLTVDPLKAMFRIHRDVRFSRDKAPYKTHAGAVLSRDGTKSSPGLLYIHLDPQGSFTAAGFWQPDPTQLSALRDAMLQEAKRFTAIVAALQKQGLDLSREEALARLPRGFDHAAGSPVGDYLRLRHLIVERRLSARTMAGSGAVEAIAEFAAAALPLLSFGWEALD